jgi:hypothetical protein
VLRDAERANRRAEAAAELDRAPSVAAADRSVVKTARRR